MKLNIDKTLEVSDLQRVQVAVIVDGGKTKPKRQATRDELKAFVWKHGEQWEEVISGLYASFTAEPQLPASETEQDLLWEEEDLLGVDDPNDVL